MDRTPRKKDFTSKEWKLIQCLNTPAKVQRWLTERPYNWERQGGTMRSFREVVKRNEAHCLEAAVAAAVILEQHGYPPLLFDLESIDLLDHVLFVFQQKGRWGSIARSRDIGLQGRKPVFRSLRELVWSYFDPYIDMTGRIKGYGLTSLYDLITTIGASMRETCTGLKVTCAPFHTRNFAHQTAVTTTGTNDIRNTKSVFRRSRLRTIPIGVSGCCDESQRRFCGSQAKIKLPAERSLSASKIAVLTGRLLFQFAGF